MTAAPSAGDATPASRGARRRGRPTRAGWIVGVLGAIAHGILVWQAVDQYTAFRDIATAFGGTLRPGTLATLVGAILGAADIDAWIVGIVVACVTLVLAAALRRSLQPSRQSSDA